MNRTIVKIILLVVVVAGAVGVAKWQGVTWTKVQAVAAKVNFKSDPSAALTPEERARLVELVPGQNDTVRFASAAALTDLGIRTSTVRTSPPPQPLRLPGTLFLDPNRLVHVHSRFAGEAVALGTIEHDGQKRPLRYGDRVQKGQLLATIWSKEIGEKKSELVDAISRLEINRSLLEKLESVSKGIVSERQVMEARREVEADLISATRVERTLRSWRLSDEEIIGVKREATQLKQNSASADSEVSRRWAETEVRAAIEGVIVEKNFNVGDIIEPTDDLFKVADLSRLQVMVNVYEEDLWAVRALAPDQRHWKLDLKADPADNAIDGTFELIGSVIDPAQRTGVLIGWLDNPSSALAAGQFITATIQLQPDQNMVALPESALIEEGGSSSIFVQTEPLTFQRRFVDVTRRMEGTILIRKVTKVAAHKPDESPHQAGEVVIVSGVLGLGGEMANLATESP